MEEREIKLTLIMELLRLHPDWEIKKILSKTYDLISFIKSTS